MREIRFRAWERELNVMVYDDETTGYIEYETNPVRAINIILNEDDYGLEYMQKTGLKTENGVEIWQNDIVLINCISDSCLMEQVVGPVEIGEYGPMVKDITCSNKEVYILDLVRRYEHLDIEVIGNIFEDGDLIANR